MQEKEFFYVMAFYSTNHSMQTEKKAREIFRITVMPTPRELTNDCGLALRFDEEDLEKILMFHRGLSVPADLYRMSVKKEGGRRKVEKIV